IFGVGFALLLVILGVVFWSVIPFALTTVVIAYLLDPLVDTFDRMTGHRRGWSILLTFVFIIMVVALVLAFIVPPLIEQTISATQSLYNSAVTLVTEPYEALPIITDPETEEVIALSDYISILLQEQGFTTVNEWIIETGRNLNLDRDTILQFLNIGGDVTTSILGSIFGLAGSALGFVFSSLFFITILAQLLNDGDAITDVLIRIVPDGYHDDARQLMRDLGGVWNAYVRGNFVLGLIMGFAMWILATVLGLPNPLFLAFIAFAVEFIPNIGPLIAMTVAVALALVGGSATFPNANPLIIAAIVAVIWMIMQQLESVVLVPRIVGESLQLHPSVVILSVIWGGSLGGLIGIIIAPPLVASIRIILQYIYGRLTGRPAFMTHSEDGDSTMKILQSVIGIFTNRNRKSNPVASPPNDDMSDGEQIAGETEITKS
ncbi:MAG: AI-2E family transporter, partial [Chloroflexota bacterium]